MFAYCWHHQKLAFLKLKQSVKNTIDSGDVSRQKFTKYFLRKIFFGIFWETIEVWLREVKDFNKEKQQLCELDLVHK